MTGLLLALLVVPGPLAEPDTTLVEVCLESRCVVVEAVVVSHGDTVDGTLELPTRDLSELFEVPISPAPRISLAGLRESFPALTFDFRPHELRLLIEDMAGILPGTRRLRDAERRRAYGTARLALVVRSGPFAAVTTDDLGRTAFDAGYSWRGRLAVQLNRSPRGEVWGASFVPVPALFLSYFDGDRQPATLTARVAAGPLWLTATSSGPHVRTDGLIQVGRLALFGSSANQFAVTLNASPVGVQLGRTGQRTTARVTYGPVPPSPFVVPYVP